MPAPASLKTIYSVSELTRKIKTCLEERFPIIWVWGEVSNFYQATSGHHYFTLKDEGAQLAAVMFSGQNRNLQFRTENGRRIIGLGRISVYEPRGTYQIILEYMEPYGIGALQVAFEQLKARLTEEGLFDAEHKKKIPYLPFCISIITSPTGAAIHDILNIIDRRFSNIRIEILPVKVQGKDAVPEIAAAIASANRRNTADLIILARGGGSLEDLAAFNSETVARAISASVLPVVSAVGHETDFTIADFVADLRAPTPSAAAELVVPVKSDLVNRVDRMAARLNTTFLNRIEFYRYRLAEMFRRLVHPRRNVQDLRLKIDDATEHMIRSFSNSLRYKKDRLALQTSRLYANQPVVRVAYQRQRLANHLNRMRIAIQRYLNEKRTIHGAQMKTLQALSPKLILARGYSITRKLPDLTVVRSQKDVNINQELEIMLAEGTLYCCVKGVGENG